MPEAIDDSLVVNAVKAFNKAKVGLLWKKDTRMGVQIMRFVPGEDNFQDAASGVDDKSTSYLQSEPFAQKGKHFFHHFRCRLSEKNFSF